MQIVKFLDWSRTNWGWLAVVGSLASSSSYVIAQDHFKQKALENRITTIEVQMAGPPPVHERLGKLDERTKQMQKAQDLRHQDDIIFKSEQRSLFREVLMRMPRSLPPVPAEPTDTRDPQ